MVFSSLYFLFLYLPIVLFAYYIAPLRWRNGVLLVLNLIFYAWGEPVYILIMFASIAIDYTHGMLVERYKSRNNDKGARLAVASSVVFNLALLFFFKYWDFVAGSLAAAGLGCLRPGVLTAAGQRGRLCLLVGEDEERFALLCRMDTDSLGRVRELEIGRDPDWEFDILETFKI